MLAHLKNVKTQKDLLVFKEKLKLVYKPVRYCHFKYGTQKGNKFLAHLRVVRSFYNSHRFVTGLSDTNKCKNCNKNKIENILHYALICPVFVSSRAIMFQKITSLVPKFPVLKKKEKVFLLLNGINLNSFFPL